MRGTVIGNEAVMFNPAMGREWPQSNSQEQIGRKPGPDERMGQGKGARQALIMGAQHPCACGEGGSDRESLLGRMPPTAHGALAAS